MELKICHLFPDILNLYGDRGNVVCMRRRLGWRGIDVSVSEVSIGTALKASDYDLFFIGGGQDFEQEVLLEDLKGGKTAEIKAAIEDGKTFLAICGGYQMLGAYYKTWDGQQCDFTGALDLYTVGHKDRMIGNYMFTCEELVSLITLSPPRITTFFAPRRLISLRVSSERESLFERRIGASSFPASGMPASASA